MQCASNGRSSDRTPAVVKLSSETTESWWHKDVGAGISYPSGPVSIHRPKRRTSRPMLTKRKSKEDGTGLNEVTALDIQVICLTPIRKPQQG